MENEETITCKHWKKCGVKHGGCCDLHGAVSFGVCNRCPDSTEIGWTKKFLRIHRPGDSVEKMTKAFGLKPCDKCKKRKAYLNGET
jgi:hypothetical protein